MLPSRRSTLFTVATLLSPAIQLSAQAAAAPLGFSDPQRVAKLSSTFGDIDRVFREHVRRARAHPRRRVGASSSTARVAHIGATGFRDVASKSPVDSGTVFRIASMTKSFTAMAILKLRDEGKLSLDDPAEKWVPELAGLKYPTTDSPKHHHPASPVARRRVSRKTTRGATSSSPSPTSEMARMMRARHSVLERARRGVRVLELRLRHPRPHRDEGVRRAVSPLRRREHPAPLGMTSTTLEPASVRAVAPRAGLSVGGRAVEARAAASRRRVRRDGRHAHVGARPGRVRRRVPRRVAAARRCGDGAREACLAARDAAAPARRGPPRSRATPTARCDSTAADTASDSASRATATSRTSSRTAADCRDSARSCAGCPSTASGSSRSATARTRAGARRPPRRCVDAEDRRARAAHAAAVTGARRAQGGGVSPDHALETTRSPTVSRRSTSSSTSRAIGARRTSTACWRRSARVAPRPASTSWRTRCAASGRCRASAASRASTITLAPTMPPTVQFLTVDALTAPEPPRRRGYCAA